MKRLLYLGIALFLIVFEAVPEGLALAGHKTIAGLIEFVFLAGVTLTVFAYFTTQYPSYYSRYRIPLNTNYWFIIVGYVLLRLALFDIIHNISAGLPILYIGTTKLFDIFIVKLASWGWFMRFIGGIIGLTWLLKK
jgi:hypothetical protein